MAGGHPLIRSHPFDPARHGVEEFECGNASLGSWLRNHAAVAARMRTAGTYVWVADGQVVGYYAVAPHAVVRDALPSKVRSNAPDPIPAYIIGKLALSTGLQGKGLGSALLLDALTRLVSVADTAPGRVVVVDAIDEAARAFYLACGLVATGAQVLVAPASEVPIVGAIGAIAGILGAYLVLHPRARVLTVIPLLVVWPVFEVPAWILLVVWFLLQGVGGAQSYGSGEAGVAFFAHIGGFVAGMALVWVFVRRGPRRRSGRAAPGRRRV